MSDMNMLTFCSSCDVVGDDRHDHAFCTVQRQGISMPTEVHQIRHNIVHAQSYNDKGTAAIQRTGWIDSYAISSIIPYGINDLLSSPTLKLLCVGVARLTHQ